MNGYAPLANFLAAHGFVVIQPTHSLFWCSRAQDMTRILDPFDLIERAVIGLAGCLDRSWVAVIEHSLRGHTASLPSAAVQFLTWAYLRTALTGAAHPLACSNPAL
ncbi:hypothetical protein [Corallococcus caeni]|uniref:Uncharacterized protein n=1 Tax=Corallococcus caeni TaxID=3082388 RepID=A0ABQ6QX92_9BACT|nr:hypothetical protein ASNO1_49180 [Corallococcus sp. NO1]